jgi:NAD(P)H-dependent FMN reductase
LRALAAHAPSDCEIRIESIADIPLYNGDDEAANGVPPAATKLKDAIAAADGLLIVTPEYNNGIPGVAKNAIDWLSRPPADIPRVFADKPVALAGASPGQFGTVLSQNAWLPVLRTLGTDLWSGRMLVPRAATAFDQAGEVVDAALIERIKKFIAGFAQYVRAKQPG